MTAEEIFQALGEHGLTVSLVYGPSKGIGLIYSV